ncbi:polysaccharide deacetylase family protein [Hymenobacter siberiensis]|uniref:polysaccharide deacetylase family protein n=1 Tax=Hymenobacter siberiensis TaxID=2848396 RepID=UPI001C1E44F9|nr:polysaccharide deacetylase family protein [Hymenobacter siberiensis]MBU6121207.1 polysaccharide deacetylase family protein [Hymenobacter siberiensis]
MAASSSARLEAAVLTRPPRLLHALLPGCEWTGPATTPAGAPVVYLTFDDGPIPEETPWVLEQLAIFNAKATFFCVGENLVRYPEIARAALAAGHRFGNHTHQHRSAWATARPAYLADIAVCQTHIDKLVQSFPEKPLTAPHSPLPGSRSPIPTFRSPLTASHSPLPASRSSLPLFRPPYGRLTWPLLPTLRRDFRVVMWSVLTRDYDPGLSPESCLRFALEAIRAGDVVVFHDSRKASARLRFVLPRVLTHLAGQGFQFATL